MSGRDFVMLALGAYFGIGLFLTSVSIQDRLIQELYGPWEKTKGLVLMVFFWPAGYFRK